MIKLDRRYRGYRQLPCDMVIFDILHHKRPGRRPRRREGSAVQAPNDHMAQSVGYMAMALLRLGHRGHRDPRYRFDSRFIAVLYSDLFPLDDRIRLLDAHYQEDWQQGICESSSRYLRAYY